ncbi:MAG: acylphosphatase [Gemmatimonadaceae bacterium]
MPAAHFKVVGRVQGVGFRWFTRVVARRLQIAGWVRNLPDGSVEVAASGREENLEEFRKLLGKGPDGAVVSDVVDLEPVVEELDFPFAVRR